MFLKSFILEECLIVVNLTGYRKMQNKHNSALVKHLYIGLQLSSPLEAFLVFSFLKKVQEQKNKKEHIVYASRGNNNMEFKFVLAILHKTLLFAKFMNK